MRKATLVLASTSTVIALCALAILASMLFQLVLRARGEGRVYAVDGQWSLYLRTADATFMLSLVFAPLLLLQSLTCAALWLRWRHLPRWFTVPLAAGWIVLALYVVGAQGFLPSI